MSRKANTSGADNSKKQPGCTFSTSGSLGIASSSVCVVLLRSRDDDDDDDNEEEEDDDDDGPLGMGGYADAMAQKGQGTG